MPLRRAIPTVAPFPTGRLPRLLLLLGGLLGLAAPAGAATLTVNSLTDTIGGPDCTLRDAITAANTDAVAGGCAAGGGADLIVFDPALTAGDETITLSTIGNSLAGPAAFGITSVITIQGPTGTHGLTLDASGAVMRHFNVAATGSLTLEYLTLTGGRAQGWPGGSGRSEFPSGGGGAAGLGGAIFNQGAVQVRYSTLSGNTAQGGAGGDTTSGGGTTAAGGGGGGGLGGNGGNSSISSGISSGGGGGGLTGNGQPGASVDAGGAGGLGGSGGVAGGAGALGAGGAAPGAGGGGGGPASGQYGVGGAGGNAGFGGGGGAGGGGLVDGGGVGGAGGFGGGGGAGGGLGGNGGSGGFGGGGGGRGNQRTATAGVGGFGAGAGGGGTVANGGGGGLGAGGALFNHQGTLSLLNTTLSGNTAAGGSGGTNATAGQGLGGGVFNLNGSVSVAFSTLAGNTANDGGGQVFNLSHEAASGITAQAAALTLSNSILALSTGGVTALINQQRAGAAAATVTATDPNLVDSSTNLGGTFNGGGILTGNPQIGALADNGGPTRTLALLTGSPAINAGFTSGCPATDQRGFTRPQPSGGACDLGAYELALTTTVLVAAPNPAVLAQTVALTATVSPNTATGTVNFQEGGSALTCAEGAQPRPLSSSSATCTVTGGFGVGPHAFTADYSSDNGYAPSQGTTSLEVLATTAQDDGLSGPVTAVITGGTCTGFATGSTSFPAPPTPLPPGVAFPYGLFGFTAVCPPGGTLTLIVTYPNPLPPGTQYWKYGPTADNTTPHWYVLPATITGNTATFTITDGGLGDDDLTDDGFIVDQGGPGAPSFVDTAAGIPTLDEWALLLFSTLFGGLLWRGRRRFG